MTRRIGTIDARYMTHPTRTHSSGDPCPVGPFPHSAEPACLDLDRIADDLAAEHAAGHHIEPVRGCDACALVMDWPR